MHACQHGMNSATTSVSIEEGEMLEVYVGSYKECPTNHPGNYHLGVPLYSGNYHLGVPLFSGNSHLGVPLYSGNSHLGVPLYVRIRTIIYILVFLYSCLFQLRCGCSYAFSAIGALEGATALAHGTVVKLSEQNIVDCSGKYLDSYLSFR